MKKSTKLLSRALGLTMGVSLLLPTLTACPKSGKKGASALVVMSEAVDGLFNPFYATTGADMEVVGMTQISMLSTDYTGEEGKEEAVVAVGKDEPVVALDYDIKYDGSVKNENGEMGQTTYTFVLKNGITFSDGHPLTMEDVLFNMYVYLDPVYAGSSTMYSTDIVGLKQYRLQKNLSDNSTDISQTANDRAANRINELINLYTGLKKVPGADTSYDGVSEAIEKHTLSDGYKKAVAYGDALKNVTVKDLQADYDFALETFRKELNSDYEAAKEAYTEEPYKSNGFDEITSFLYMEGFVSVEYEKKQLANGRETDDKSRIKKVDRKGLDERIKTKEQAIEYVYNAKIESELDSILSYWGTANTLRTEFASRATEVILHETLKDGELAYKNISGITSLGHTVGAPATVTMNGNTYTVATGHNADGTVTKPDSEYDVLQIKINGVDPKAIWNFGFTVAPQHYYAEKQTVDIVNNKFGVVWGDFGFMKNEIQSTRNVKVPMGAGPYVATDAKNRNNPDGNDFNKNNVIYFKANKNFMLGAPKTEKLRYQVVSANNALDILEQGSVHFVTPQFSKQNIERLSKMKNVETKEAWQLGYGYVGINAGKVPDLNLRKAIMSAMDPTLARSYYSAGTVEMIAWPMSIVSWAYPKDANDNRIKDNGHDYADLDIDNDEKRISLIEGYMKQAGVSAGDKKLKITFTIAGSNLTEHPTYETFKHAADLLNSCGWDIDVIPDVNALNKLSTGALSVWAAAWGSTIDPDMYQVYHKNSTATSTTAWGYKAIKQNPGQYPRETTIINQLSELIDEGRETEDRATRIGIYTEAMSKVLDLAIELPIYQRKNLYVYNPRVIKTSSLPAVVNPYSSPLSRIWEVEIK